MLPVQVVCKTQTAIGGGAKSRDGIGRAQGTPRLTGQVRDGPILLLLGVRVLVRGAGVGILFPLERFAVLLPVLALHPDTASKKSSEHLARLL